MTLRHINELGWNALAFAELPDVSMSIFLYDMATAARYAAPMLLLNNLEDVGLLDHTSSMDMLGPVQSGWQRIGLMGAQPVKRAGRLKQVMMVYALAFDWNPTRRAHEALLYTHDTVPRVMISLDPQAVVPMLWLARMAAWPMSTTSNRQARLVPSLQHAQHDLSWLMSGLFHTWLAGPSESAAFYRSRAGTPRNTRGEREGVQTIDALRSLVGPHAIEAIGAADRPEPAILRLLDQVSFALWHDSDTINRARALAPRPTSPAGRLVRGLLAPALWCEDPPWGPGADDATEQWIWKTWQHWNPNAPRGDVPPPGTARPIEQDLTAEDVATFMDMDAMQTEDLSEIMEALQTEDLAEIMEALQTEDLAEINMWVMHLAVQAAQIAQTYGPNVGRGLVTLTLTADSTRQSPTIRRGYIPLDELKQVVSNAGDRQAVAFLSHYDPAKEFMVCIVKSNCDPSRAFATFHFDDFLPDKLAQQPRLGKVKVGLKAKVHTWVDGPHARVLLVVEDEEHALRDHDSTPDSVIPHLRVERLSVATGGGEGLALDDFPPRMRDSHLITLINIHDPSEGEEDQATPTWLLLFEWRRNHDPYRALLRAMRSGPPKSAGNIPLLIFLSQIAQWSRSDLGALRQQIQWWTDYFQVVEERLLPITALMLRGLITTSEPAQWTDQLDFTEQMCARLFADTIRAIQKQTSRLDILLLRGLVDASHALWGAGAPSAVHAMLDLTDPTSEWFDSGAAEQLSIALCYLACIEAWTTPRPTLLAKPQFLHHALVVRAWMQRLALSDRSQSPPLATDDEAWIVRQIQNLADDLPWGEAASMPTSRLIITSDMPHAVQARAHAYWQCQQAEKGEMSALGRWTVRISARCATMHRYDITKLVLIGSDEGFWVLLQPLVGRGCIVGWKPDAYPPAVWATLLSPDIIWELHAVLASLWHDFRILGPAQILHDSETGAPVAPYRRTETPKRKPQRGRQAERPNGLPALYLPRSESVGRADASAVRDSDWGSLEDRAEVRRRRVHHVRVFARRIAGHASQELRDYVRSIGLPDLPETGLTMVRPHARGNKSDEVFVPRPVISKGLLSLELMLNSRELDSIDEQLRRAIAEGEGEA